MVITANKSQIRLFFCVLCGILFNAVRKRNSLTKQKKEKNMSDNNSMKYRVGTLRAAGLKARWGRSIGGSPILLARESEIGTWYHVNKAMWEQMKKVGVLESFRQCTMLGDIFSIPA